MKYTPTDEKLAQVEKVFTFHPAKDDQPERYQELREAFKQLATKILELTPPSREQSLALTNLEEASLMANAAIARNE